MEPSKEAKGETARRTVMDRLEEMLEDKLAEIAANMWQMGDTITAEQVDQMAGQIEETIAKIDRTES